MPTATVSPEPDAKVLELGADYLVTPFEPDVVAGRVRGIFRRTEPAA